MNVEVLRRRREELLREAELARLRVALRANRGRPAILRLGSTVAWELARAGGLLRKFLRTLRKTG
jgi:hypothetical protein